MVTAEVVWDPSFTAYDFGPGHPMGPARLDLTARLASALGVLDDVRILNPGVATEEVLRTVHTAQYIAAVRAASADPESVTGEHGLGTADDPAFAGMHEASARIVEGTRQLCEDVWTGAVPHGVNFCGGLHHAMADSASGFCVYNDVAVGIRWLLDHGAQRVAYVDIDVHHGDGVEQLFWDDSRVLTVSVHENGQALFPGTGWPREIGGPAAQGSAANVALPPGTGDSAWLRAINSVVLPLVRAFEPDILVTQHGCDTHIDDPLAHLAISVDAQRYAAEALHRLAHDVCGGKWVALGGGGYDLVNVVPRAWTHLTAIAAHHPVALDAPVPQGWRDHVRTTYGRPGPARMGDLPLSRLPIWVQPWSHGHNPDNPADRAIMATREAVFAHHGLDSWFD